MATSTPCIEWPKARTRAGYGVTTINRKTRYVHRLEMEKKTGRTLTTAEVVCHACDNPACYNIEHLFLGTQADNVRDMHLKNRHAKGFALPQTKLSPADKLRIIRMRNSGYISRVIAEHFDVSRSVITKIITASRRTYLEG